MAKVRATVQELAQKAFGDILKPFCEGRAQWDAGKGMHVATFVPAEDLANTAEGKSKHEKRINITRHLTDKLNEIAAEVTSPANIEAIRNKLRTTLAEHKGKPEPASSISREELANAIQQTQKKIAIAEKLPALIGMRFTVMDEGSSPRIGLCFATDDQTDPHTSELGFLHSAFLEKCRDHAENWRSPSTTRA